LTVIGLLSAALLTVYVELAATLLIPYGLYVAVLAARRQLTTRSVLTLWAAALACTAIALNTYLSRELGFVRAQASTGVSGPTTSFLTPSYRLVSRAPLDFKSLQRAPACAS
jgi:hypothetical protein